MCVQQNREKGQAMIEFVFGLMIVISFFFFYVRMCAIFAVGNFVHYATFMAARAYQSSTQTPDEQTQNAASVLKTMLGGRFKTLIKGKGGDGTSIPGATIGAGPYYQQFPTEDYWNQGVTFEYTAKLALYPWSRNGQSIALDLTSESWMPREETTQECTDKKSKIQAALNSNGGISNVIVEWDNVYNGC